MSELISGKEALTNIENSEISYNASKWFPLVNCEFKLHELLNGRSDTGNSLKFRLKPRTIKLNGIEVPAPFKPKDGERFYTLVPDHESGYDTYLYVNNDFCRNIALNIGAWRTESEIKQVVAALRSVFNES